MIIPDIKINQIITIEVLDEENNLEKLPSRIEEVMEDAMRVSMPERINKLPLQLNDRDVTLVFTTSQGVFAASSKVLKQMNEPVRALVVEIPKSFTLLEQKREHVRLDISLPVFYLTDEADNALATGNLIEGTTNNVSAGGLYFRTSGTIEQGQILKLKVHLSDKDIMNCQADVRRVSDANSEVKALGVGVQFFDITENDADNIYKFIFSKQREWIRKGLL